jgi:hypothetical protein
MSNAILEELDILRQKGQPNFRTFHIFKRLLGQLTPNISLESRLELVWTFSVVEKCLFESRKSNHNNAQFYIDQLEAKNQDSDRLISSFKDMFVLPAKAFYEYHNKGNYDEAIRMLSNSIVSIQFFTESGYPDAFSASVEQYLNICRVHLKIGDKDVAYKEIGNLLYYLISGEIKNSFVDLSNGGKIKPLNGNDLYLLIDFITDVAVMKLLNEDEENFEKFQAYLFQAFAGFTFSGEDEYKLLYWRSINYLTSITSEESSEKLLLFFSHIHKLPRNLQYLLLSRLNRDTKLFDKNYSIIASKIRSYCEEVLKIPYPFKANKSSDNYAGSPIRDFEYDKRPELALHR